MDYFEVLHACKIRFSISFSFSFRDDGKVIVKDISDLNGSGLCGRSRLINIYTDSSEATSQFMSVVTSPRTPTQTIGINREGIILDTCEVNVLTK